MKALILAKCILREICECMRVVVVICQGSKTVGKSCHLAGPSVLRCVGSPKVTCQHYSLLGHGSVYFRDRGSAFVARC